MRACSPSAPVTPISPAGRPAPRILLTAAAFAILLGWPGDAPRLRAQAPPAAPAGQTQPAAPPPAQAEAAGQPTFRTEANFVETDVFVTKDGEPVLDLTQADFELREDGAPQAIRTFEHVRIRPGENTGRRTPSTVAESEAAASDPRRRVFVLFLDTFHVSRAESMRLRKTLADFVETMLAPDDLLALMTPSMAGSDLAFSSRPDAVKAFFETNPIWGLADELPGAETDPAERAFSTCHAAEKSQWPRLRARFREQRTFKAMLDLVHYLDALRESRKAIVVVSEGWTLFKANERLMTEGNQTGQPPGRPIIGVGPDGQLGNQNRYRAGGASQYDCDTLLLEMANVDTRDDFRTRVIGEANRANASFYTVDAAGLRAEARRPDLGSGDPAQSMRNPDRDEFSTPYDTLRVLGPSTNGMSITDTNDTAGGLRRVVNDFNSFYLLGYNSTNSKPDGKYRRITVRVKRPGVQVRHREGYRAREKGSAVPRPGSTATPTSPGESVVATALLRLQSARPNTPVLLYASAGNGAESAQPPVVRIVAELEAALVQTPDWREGGQVQVIVKNAAGASVTTSDQKFAPGERIVRVDVPLPADTAAGDLRVQVRLTGAGALARFMDATNVHVDEPSARWGAPIVWRRGPTTGIAYVPTADLRFRRQERVRIELPGGTPEAVTASLVDRNGKPLEVPVRVSAAPAGLAADVSLAPLAAGDYAIVLTRGGAGEQRLAVPLRVVP